MRIFEIPLRSLRQLCSQDIADTTDFAKDARMWIQGSEDHLKLGLNFIPTEDTSYDIIYTLKKSPYTEGRRGQQLRRRAVPMVVWWLRNHRTT